MLGPSSRFFLLWTYYARTRAARKGIAPGMRLRALDFAAPVELFPSPIAAPSLGVDQYSVTKDGKRFLFIRPRETAVVRPPVTVVVNWPSAFKH